jgi:hypothetical protein
MFRRKSFGCALEYAVDQIYDVVFMAVQRNGTVQELLMYYL